jgi:hypothetical protein
MCSFVCRAGSRIFGARARGGGECILIPTFRFVEFCDLILRFWLILLSEAEFRCVSGFWHMHALRSLNDYAEASLVSDRRAMLCCSGRF